MRISDWSSDVCSSDLSVRSLESIQIAVGKLELVDVVIDGGQHDIGGKRQRCGHGPGGNRPVVGAIGCAPANVVVELALCSVDIQCLRTRPVAGGNTDRKSTRLHSSH